MKANLVSNNQPNWSCCLLNISIELTQCWHRNSGIILDRSKAWCNLNILMNRDSICLLVCASELFDILSKFVYFQLNKFCRFPTQSKHSNCVWCLLSINSLFCIHHCSKMCIEFIWYAQMPVFNYLLVVSVGLRVRCSGPLTGRAESTHLILFGIRVIILARPYTICLCILYTSLKFPCKNRHQKCFILFFNCIFDLLHFTLLQASTQTFHRVCILCTTFAFSYFWWFCVITRKEPIQILKGNSFHFAGSISSTFPRRIAFISRKPM